MSTLPFTGKIGAALIPVAALALVVAACTGGDGTDGEDDGGPVLTPVSGRFLPQTVSSDLAVGLNRFMIGLIDQEENAPIADAQLHLRFFKLDGSERTLKSELDAQAITVEKSFTHTHEDGTIETHEAGELGVYVASVEFDSAGDWAVEVSGSVDGQPIEPVATTFTVREQSLAPAIGEPAPLTVQTIVSDVSDVSEIDTSDPPNADMHDMTIADAVRSGRPTVIAFATPAFCVSQICGPTKDVVDQLYEKYKAQANFVHVEPYDVARVREGECASLFDCRVPAVDEWGLASEPWVFLVDSEGNVTAKFEAVVTLDELEQALSPLVGAAAAGSGSGYAY